MNGQKRKKEELKMLIFTSAMGFLAAGVATLSLSAAQPYEPPKTELTAIETEAETFPENSTEAIIYETEATTEAAETEEEREYLGEWRVTEYCAKCNSGSAHQTASGKRAEEYWTCAVSRENYKRWKGCKLYIEGYGEFEVQDWGSVHGCDKNRWVDLFLPTSNHNRVYDEVEVYLIQD